MGRLVEVQRDARRRHAGAWVCIQRADLLG